jgi:hypothetical protein
MSATMPYLKQVVEFIDVVAGIYFRSSLMENAGDMIGQHVHEVSHATYVGSGSVRVWVNENHVGDFTAGHAIEVRAGDYHVLQALEPNTRISCVFNAEDPIVKRWIEGHEHGN